MKNVRRTATGLGRTRPMPSGEWLIFWRRRWLPAPDWLADVVEAEKRRSPVQLPRRTLPIGWKICDCGLLWSSWNPAGSVPQDGGPPAFDAGTRRRHSGLAGGLECSRRAEGIDRGCAGKSCISRSGPVVPAIGPAILPPAKPRIDAPPLPNLPKPVASPVATPATEVPQVLKVPQPPPKKPEPVVQERAKTPAEQMLEVSGFDSETGQILHADKFRRWKQQQATASAASAASQPVVSNASLLEVSARAAPLSKLGWMTKRVAFASCTPSPMRSCGTETCRRSWTITRITAPSCGKSCCCTSSSWLTIGENIQALEVRG